jgi:non-specific serine/threonine protein kinase
VDIGLRLASSVWRYWQTSGQLTEGRRWLEQLLAAPRGATTARAKALVALAGLVYWQADHEEAWSRYQEALALYRSVDDQSHEADVLYGMSMTATWRGDPETGMALAGEARALFEEQGARAKVGECLMAQGFALWQTREYGAARPLWEEALRISRELGDEALAVTQLAGIAGMEFHTGDRTVALRIALDALALARDIENLALSVWLLDFIAAFAASDAPAAAVRIAGAADALRLAAGGGMRIEDLHIESARSAASRSLTPDELEAAWATGRTMTLDEAISAADDLHRAGIERATDRPEARAVVPDRAPRLPRPPGRKRGD